jgi:UDP-glucuronosyl/UDP-glucosyltransferase
MWLPASWGPVCLRGYSQRFLSPIEKAGFEYRALTPEMNNSEIGMAMDLDQGRGLRHPFMAPMVQRRVISARSLIQKQKVDAVVIGTTLGQLISARAEKASLFYVKPFAYLMPHMAQMRRTGFLPRETMVQRLISESAARFFRNLVVRLLPMPRGLRSAGRGRCHAC